MERNFRYLREKYTQSGAREKFEEICIRLLHKHFGANAHGIRVCRGDGGIDALVGDFTAPLDIYQCKFFLDGIGDSQKSQIRKSFKTALSNQNFIMKSWTLCIPIAMSKSEFCWWSRWKKKHESKARKIKLFDGPYLIDQLKEHGLYDEEFDITHISISDDIYSGTAVPLVASPHIVHVGRSLKDRDAWLEHFQDTSPDTACRTTPNSFANSTASFGFHSYSPIENVDPSFNRMRLSSKGTITSSPMEKETILLDYLSQFKKIVKETYAEPVVRFKALYSGFCTIWEESNHSDLASMERTEKEFLIQLVELGCDVRLIVNLDVEKAIACGFSKEEIMIRVADLCSICDRFSTYKNFRIAVYLESAFYEPYAIFSRILFNRHINFQTRENYAYSRWDSDQAKIDEICRRFDTEFYNILNSNINFKAFIGKPNMSASELIFMVVRARLAKT